MDENNKNVDLISENPKLAIRKLSFSIMVTMIFTALYSLIDCFWLVKLGPESISALGYVTPLFSMILGIANGLGVGINSLISREIGAKNKKYADNVACHGIMLTVVISLIVPLLVLPIFSIILRQMGASNQILDLSVEYGSILFLFMIVFVFSGISASILRAEGDVKREMYAMLFTVILNIILDPIFIFYFNWGMLGAAWATVLSNLVFCIIISYWLWIKKDTFINISRFNFTFMPSIIKEIMSVAVPVISETFCWSIMLMIINFMFTFVSGSTAVGVYTITSTINQFARIPILSIGSSTLTVIAVSYGAQKYKRLIEIHKYAILIGLIVSIALASIIFLGSSYIHHVLTYAPRSRHLAIQIINALRLLSFYIVVMPIGVVSVMTFKGMGEGLKAFIITLFRSLIAEVLFAYIFGIVLSMGESGIYIGIVVGCTVVNILGSVWCKYYLDKLSSEQEILAT